MGYKLKRIMMRPNGVEKQVRPQIKEITLSSKILIDSNHRLGGVGMITPTQGFILYHTTYGRWGTFVNYPDKQVIAYNYSSLNGWYDFIVSYNKETFAMNVKVEQNGNTIWTSSETYELVGDLTVGLFGGGNSNDRNCTAEGYVIKLDGQVYKTYDFTGGIPAGTNVYDGAENVTNTGYSISGNTITLSTNPYSRSWRVDEKF